MSEPADMNAYRERKNLPVVDGGLNSTGGDGTSGGMEARVAKLETGLTDFRLETTQEFAAVKTKLATIEERLTHTALNADLQVLKERISHLPSKEYISTRLLGLLGTIAALILFADKVKALIGLH